MLDDDQLEQTVRELIIDLCEVLYYKGYREVSIGAMMRLVGVGNDSASKHDDTFFSLDEDFISIMESRKISAPEPMPSGVTLH
jgi:hypothetical protein